MSPRHQIGADIGVPSRLRARRARALLALPAAAGCLLCCGGADLTTDAKTRSVYVHTHADTPGELETLARFATVDNVKGSDVWAYVAPWHLQELRTHAIDWEELPHPGFNPGARMGMLDRSGSIQPDSFPTYSEYVTFLRELESSYPDLCRLVDVGDSTNQDRPHDIWMLEITDNPDVEEDEPEVLLTSTMHGDETTGYVLMLYLADELLSSYGDDPDITALVDEIEIWINPLANPDGAYYAGDDTLDGAIRGFTDANGAFADVDPNRNFPDFLYGDHPDGNRTWSENLAMTDFSAAHTISLSVNFHGGTEVVNYAWDNQSSRHADNAWFEAISRAYADHCQEDGPRGYMTDQNDGITNGYDWYQITGSRQDYMTYFVGAREVTIELSTRKNPDASSLSSYWQANRAALLEYAERSLEGVRGVVTDARGEPVFARVEVVGHDSVDDNSYVYTDADVGDYHRMLLPGSYDLEFVAEGFTSQVVAGVDVAAGEAARVDVVLHDNCVGSSDACDDSNPCTEERCDAALGCVYEPVAGPCDDQNPCTTADVCQAGVCSGEPKVCAASNACHEPGECDPTTGECSDPPKADGEACDVEDLCLQGGVCKGGICDGAEAVVCEPLDACHLAGRCDPATGKCGDPVAQDGVSCPEGSCVNGTCSAAASSALVGYGRGCTTAGSAARPAGLFYALAALLLLRRRQRLPHRARARRSD